MSCLALSGEIWPAGASGTKVSAARSFGFVLNPSKNAEQKGRFPPGSFDEEHRLVLFDNCLMSVPIGVGPPLPPVNEVPEALAVNDADVNDALCVTAVDIG